MHSVAALTGTADCCSPAVASCSATGDQPPSSQGPRPAQSVKDRGHDLVCMQYSLYSDQYSIHVYLNS